MGVQKNTALAIDQIRRAHGSARPKQSNPAWMNCHHDRGMLLPEIERLRAALTTIDGIRNSIIGAQSVNWSEHIYPLVEALETAGFEGEGYDKAREKIRALIGRRERAEAVIEAVREFTGGGPYMAGDMEKALATYDERN